MGQECNWSANKEKALKGLVIVVGGKLTLEKYYSYDPTQHILKCLENQIWLSNLFFFLNQLSRVFTGIQNTQKKKIYHVWY